MKAILFAVKRTLKSVSFLVMLVIYAAAILAASLEGASGTNPPAGVYGRSDSAETRRIMDYLTENGFVRYDDPEQMRLLVESGKLDCAVILPDDLLLRMERGELEGCVEFITSPLSFLPRIYQNHVSAAVFRECAPYIAAETLKDSGVPQREVMDEYEKQFEKGYVFSFELLTSDGMPAETEHERELVMGAASLLMFALLMSAGAGDAHRDIILRIGVRRALTRIVLPGVLTRSAFAVAAGSAALAAVGSADLILPLAVYALLLSALSIFLSAALPDERDRYILLTVVLILSLALCPIYVDLALFSPLFGKVRWMLPPYWFYLVCRAPVIWLVVAAGGLIFACGAVFVRARIRNRLQS